MATLNKSRQRGSTPDFPRLLGERLCLDFANTVEGPLSAEPVEFLHHYVDLVRWGGHAGLLDAAETIRIMQAREQLKTVRASNDKKAIKQAMERLEKASNDWVARRMNASVRKAMAGHSVEEFTQIKK